MTIENDYKGIKEDVFKVKISQDFIGQDYEETFIRIKMLIKENEKKKL